MTRYVLFWKQSSYCLLWESCRVRCHHLVETLTSVNQRCVALALVKENHPALSDNSQRLVSILFHWCLKEVLSENPNWIHSTPNCYLMAVNAGFPVPIFRNFAFGHGNEPHLYHCILNVCKYKYICTECRGYCCRSALTLSTFSGVRIVRERPNIFFFNAEAVNLNFNFSILFKIIWRVRTVPFLSTLKRRCVTVPESPWLKTIQQQMHDAH